MAGDLRTNRNELNTLFVSSWNSLPTLLAQPFGPWPYVLAMTDADSVPVNPLRLPWARFTVQHTGSKSRAISGRRTVNRGVITGQLFVFRDRTSADNLVQVMAGKMVELFQRHRGNVALFDIGAVERPINSGYAQCDVSASFTWDGFTKRG